jgi:endonuclease VIII
MPVPEGDTVHLVATRMDRALSGATVRRGDLRVPRHATADLSGRTIEGVVARGKHLLTRFSDDLTLHTHFRMDGAWHLYRPGAAWRGPAHEIRAVLETPEWVAVGFRLAAVDLIERGAEADYVGHLGPDVLGPDWDPNEAARRLRAAASRPIGEALLDQRVLAGVGNVYRCEVCFLRGLHPETPVAEAGDVDALVALVKAVMEANRAGARQITTGDSRPGRRNWVYGRSHRPCFRCGTTIRKAGTGAGERVTYWCPSCQPIRPVRDAPARA